MEKLCLENQNVIQTKYENKISNSSTICIVKIQPKQKEDNTMLLIF